MRGECRSNPMTDHPLLFRTHNCYRSGYDGIIPGDNEIFSNIEKTMLLKDLQLRKKITGSLTIAAESLQGTRPLTSADAICGVPIKTTNVRKDKNQRFIVQILKKILLTNYLISII